VSLPGGQPRSRPIDVSRATIVVAAIVYITYLFTEKRLDDTLRAFGVLTVFLIAVFADRFGSRWPAWAAVATVMVTGIAMRPLEVPNHHYMLTYVSCALALSLSGAPERREALLQTNARWMLVALMSIATLQRLLQPAFLDGSYLGFELVRGGFLKPLLPLFGNVASIATANNAAAEAFRATPPWVMTEVFLTAPFAAVDEVAHIFVAAILGIEAWVAFVMWKYPERPVSHLSLWFFAGTLSLLRQEMMFITVLCTVGLMSCPRSLPRIRLGYLLLACVFASTVLKIKST
jgi:hypothetical protein